MFETLRATLTAVPRSTKKIEVAPALVGLEVGSAVGHSDGSNVGAFVGSPVGGSVGIAVVGSRVGAGVGAADGEGVGADEGANDGACVGDIVGNSVGSLVGLAVGEFVLGHGAGTEHATSSNVKGSHSFPPNSGRSMILFLRLRWPMATGSSSSVHDLEHIVHAPHAVAWQSTGHGTG